MNTPPNTLTPVNILVVTAKPNLDKIYMAWMTIKFGDKLFKLHPEFVYANFSGGLLPEGKNAETLLHDQGMLFLDCGGPGRFNGHCREKDDRISGSMLMATELGLTHDPKVCHLTNSIDHQDLNGRKFRDELGTVVNDAYRIGRTEEEVREMVFQIFDMILEFNTSLIKSDRAVKANSYHSLRLPALLKLAKKFEGNHALISEWAEGVIEGAKALQKAGKELALKAKPISLKTKWGNLDLRISRSDGNPTVSGNLHYLGADVVICRLTLNGKTSMRISVSRGAKERGVNLKLTAANLRLASAKKRGVRLVRGEDWGCEGVYTLIPELHVHEGIGHTAIYLGGTEHHPDVADFNLDREEILDAVIAGLTTGENAAPKKQNKPKHNPQKRSSHQGRRKNHSKKSDRNNGHRAKGPSQKFLDSMKPGGEKSLGSIFDGDQDS